MYRFQLLRQASNGTAGEDLTEGAPVFVHLKGCRRLRTARALHTFHAFRYFSSLWFQPLWHIQELINVQHDLTTAIHHTVRPLEKQVRDLGHHLEACSPVWGNRSRYDEAYNLTFGVAYDYICKGKAWEKTVICYYNGMLFEHPLIREATGL